MICTCWSEVDFIELLVPTRQCSAESRFDLNPPNLDGDHAPFPR